MEFTHAINNPLPSDKGASPVGSQRSYFVRNLPNAITFGTVLCGFFQMIAASDPNVPTWCCVLSLAVGLVCDILDGYVARKLNVKSKLGSSFDQLADLVCFGVGPGIFFTKTQLARAPSGNGLFCYECLVPLIVGYAYVACSVFRIARELVVHNGDRPVYFVGIPTNFACIFVVLMSAMLPDSPALPFVVTFVSFMMVAPIKIPKGLWVIDVPGNPTAENTGNKKGK